jgi:tricorn protease
MRGPGLEMLDLSTGKTKPLFFHLTSDQPHARPFLAPAAAFVQNMNLAPDGKRVLVETRGQIASIPVEDGAARTVLATPGVRYRKAALSPDKKQLAYVSDQSGEEEIYVSDADGKGGVPWTRDRDRQITELRWSPNGKFLTYSDSTYQTYVLTSSSQWPLKLSHGPFSRIPYYDISPDGSWIVAQQENPRTRFSSLVLTNVATHQATPINLQLMDASAPCFSRDGKWIGFLAGGALSPD